MLFGETAQIKLDLFFKSNEKKEAEKKCSKPSKHAMNAMYCIVVS